MAGGQRKALYGWFERRKAQLRAIVEQLFHVIKNLLGYRKAGFRGMAKNEVRTKAHAALAKPHIARRALITHGVSASAAGAGAGRRAAKRRERATWVGPWRRRMWRGGYSRFMTKQQARVERRRPDLAHLDGRVERKRAPAYPRRAPVAQRDSDVPRKSAGIATFSRDDGSEHKHAMAVLLEAGALAGHGVSLMGNLGKRKSLASH